MKRTALDDPRYYLNRHIQWLEFNRRVLEEARDIGNPLLERVKFLAITANNLDEFVEVRVSSFLQRIEHGSRETSPDGLTTEEELAKVSAAMHVLVRDQDQYSRPRAVRNGHGFSVQEHLIRLAGGHSDSPRTSARATPQVVYTTDGVKNDPVNPSDESDTQDSANAAV